MRPSGEGAPEPEPIVFASYRSHGIAAAQERSAAQAQEQDVESVLHSLRELTNKGAANSAAADAVLAEVAAAHKAANPSTADLGGLGDDADLETAFSIMPSVGCCRLKR